MEINYLYHITIIQTMLCWKIKLKTNYFFIIHLFQKLEHLHNNYKLLTYHSSNAFTKPSILS